MHNFSNPYLVYVHTEIQKSNQQTRSAILYGNVFVVHMLHGCIHALANVHVNNMKLVTSELVQKYKYEHDNINMILVYMHAS